MARLPTDLRQRIAARWKEAASAPDPATAAVLAASVRARHPGFVRAVLADVQTTAAFRGDRWEFRSDRERAVQAVRLAFVTDSFFAQICYRAKARCQARGIPLLDRVFHRLAIVTGQICIGDPVVVQPGVYIPHGQVVVDGITDIGTGVVLTPFVTIGLVAGQVRGPIIGDHVSIGTGAKFLGPVQVGANAVIGANAVVLSDVPRGATAVGVPARLVE
ncbi:hypothetical protein BH10ACT1_BH10ACT1_43330 [soil metagenome]